MKTYAQTERISKTIHPTYINDTTTEGGAIYAALLHSPADSMRSGLCGREKDGEEANSRTDSKHKTRKRRE